MERCTAISESRIFAAVVLAFAFFPLIAAAQASSQVALPEELAAKAVSNDAVVYGGVFFGNGTPAEGVVVHASWKDDAGIIHTIITKTLTSRQAVLVGYPQLSGYYFFNRTLLPPSRGSLLDVQNVAVNDSVNIDQRFADKDVLVNHTIPFEYVYTLLIGEEGIEIIESVSDSRAAALPDPGSVSGNFSAPLGVAEETRTDAAVQEQENAPQPLPSPSEPPITISRKLAFWMTASVLLFALIAHLYFRHSVAVSSEARLRLAIRDTFLSSVKRAMSSDFVGIGEDCALESVVDILLKKNVKGAVVMRSGVPVGWVSEEAVNGGILLGNDALSAKVSSVGFARLPEVQLIDSLLDAAKALIKSGKEAAFVKDGSRVVGVISLAEIAAGLDDFYSRHSIQSERLPNAASMMSEKLAFVSKDDTLRKAKQLMRRSGIGCVVVDGKAPAILTEHDILGEIYNSRERAAGMKVSSAAKSPVRTVFSHANAFEVNGIMLKSFTRLPVMRQARIRGVVEQRAVVRSIIQYLERISGLLEKGKRVSVEEN